MAILAIIYLIVGLFFANHKLNNPDPSIRPLWASDASLPFILRALGFILFALVWPLIMLTAPRRRY